MVGRCSTLPWTITAMSERKSDFYLQLLNMPARVFQGFKAKAEKDAEFWKAMDESWGNNVRIFDGQIYDGIDVMGVNERVNSEVHRAANILKTVQAVAEERGDA